MKKTNYLVLGIMTLITLLAIGLSTPANSQAGDVDFYFGIGIGVPPVRVVEPPPPIFLIPQTPVYYTPYFETPIFFYAGYWYRLFDECWYRGISYSGPWHYIHYTYVPSVIINLPSHYYQKHYYHKHKDHERRRFEKKHKDEWRKIKYQKYYY